MRLYVGNLPYSAEEDELRAAFEPHGTVTDVRVVRDRDTGRSRGFGFVEFGSADEGNKAIEEMNGKELDGRALVVNEARERTERAGRGGGGSGGGRRGGW